MVKGLTWKLGLITGLITSLAALPILAPFCAKDDCYDRGGVEPLGTWSWPLQGWVYLLVVGGTPGLALGAIVSRIRRDRNDRRAA